MAGEWATINFTTTSSEIQLEYYDQGLTKDGNARHYQYVWPGDYAIAQLTIQVQQPSGATDMRIAPSLGAGVVGSDNLTYYTQDIGAITAGQNIQITLDYQKSSDALSAENLPVQPSAPVPQSTASDLNISTWLAMGIRDFGSRVDYRGHCMVLANWQATTYSSRPVASAQGLDPMNQRVILAPVRLQIYCSQCGKRASPGDQFCRSCGTQIRSR